MKMGGSRFIKPKLPFFQQGSGHHHGARGAGLGVHPVHASTMSTSRKSPALPTVECMPMTACQRGSGASGRNESMESMRHLFWPATFEHAAALAQDSESANAIMPSWRAMAAEVPERQPLSIKCLEMVSTLRNIGHLLNPNISYCVPIEATNNQAVKVVDYVDRIKHSAQHGRADRRPADPPKQCQPRGSGGTAAGQ